MTRTFDYTRTLAPNLKAWQRLHEQDPKWTYAWNAYVNDHWRDEEHKALVRADGPRLAAHQAVIDATSVRAKRTAIRNYLASYAPNYLPPRRRRKES